MTPEGVYIASVKMVQAEMRDRQVREVRRLRALRDRLRARLQRTRRVLCDSVCA